MAPTIRQVLEAIEGRLETISGLRVTGHVPDQINPPQAFVGVPPIEDYHQALGGRGFDIQPTVTVLVSANLDRVGQLLLAEYADPDGPRSIPATIEANRSLGDVVGDCSVKSFQPLGREEVGQIGFLGGVFTLRVLA